MKVVAAEGDEDEGRCGGRRRRRRQRRRKEKKVKVATAQGDEGEGRCDSGTDGSNQEWSGRGEEERRRQSCMAKPSRAPSLWDIFDHHHHHCCHVACCPCAITFTCDCTYIIAQSTVAARNTSKAATSV
ncbi:hypothetical protein Q3G72_016691 [Acer saccharum]|nr:hypothetical protein Q3G72_016691 [Acer saccharum]